jgi:hypothetical protein
MFGTGKHFHSSLKFEIKLVAHQHERSKNSALQMLPLTSEGHQKNQEATLLRLFCHNIPAFINKDVFNTNNHAVYMLQLPLWPN